MLHMQETTLSHNKNSLFCHSCRDYQREFLIEEKEYDEERNIKK